MISIIGMRSDKVQLSFAIACGGRAQLRDRLEKSLARAALPFSHEVIYQESLGQGVSQLRNQLFATARGDYVYFLDEDCEWPPDFPIALLHAAMNNGFAFCGPYRDGPVCTFFGRAYNFMTQSWLNFYARLGAPVPVAGNVLIPKKSPLAAPYAETSGFGGEEASLVRNLQTAGIELRYDPNFAVLHNAQHSLGLFFSRAWLHGHSPAPGHSGHVNFKWSRFAHALPALPSLNPLMVFILFTYSLTQMCSRMWSRTQCL